MKINLFVNYIFLFLLCICAVPAAGQEKSDPGVTSILDGIFTKEQSERGKKAFEKSCGSCHMPQQFKGPGFIDAWNGRTGTSSGLPGSMPRGSRPGS